MVPASSISCLPLLHIAFLADFVKEYGFWALTLICMVPFFSFIGYVWWFDARAAKRSQHH